MVVALGGDGLMLQTLHRVMPIGIPVYGMNFGSVGFMMNSFSEDDLAEWLASVQRMVFARQQAVAAALQANANRAIAYEQQVSRTLKAAEQVAAFVREQYLAQGRGIDLRDWVGRRVIREQMFTIVSVVDASGLVVSSSQEVGTVAYGDRAFFQRQRDATSDELYVSAPVVGRVSGRWQIPMSLRITRADGSFGGVVVLSVDPTDFTVAASGGDMTGMALSNALANGDVEIRSTDGASGVNGDVNIKDTVSWSQNTLTLNALHDINILSAMNGSDAAGLALE